MSSIASGSSTHPTATAVSPRWLQPLLRIDAVGSVVIGVALVVAAGTVQGRLGLGSIAPIVLLGALFVVNGPVNGVAARRLTRASLVGPVTIDAVFGVVMLAVAIADPSGAELWARWGIAAVGVLSLDLAVAKAWGRTRLHD